MPTICSKCGNEINEESDTNRGKKYLYCKCGFMTPKGSDSYFNRKGILKGGVNMTEKKSQAKKPTTPKAPKEPKEKVSGKSEIRIENAKKLIEFMKNELKIDYPEMRKTCSNAYGQIVKLQKK
jgi:hypothetical protein